MENLLTLLRANPRTVLGGLAVVLGLLFLFQFTDYGATLWHKLTVGKEQTAAEAAHTKRAATSARRHTAYQLDSTRRATERAPLLLTDSTLAAQDRALSTSRPARVELPASPQPSY